MNHVASATEMEEQSQPATAQCRIALYDLQPLRRAEFLSFLSSWQTEQQVVVYDALASAAGVISEPAKMAFINLGASSVRTPQVRAWLSELTAMETPPVIVVISDREDPAEVVLAFEANAKGYIPTSIAPELALQAFTLILNGGVYFPPATLLRS
ncbi:response regulator transcription factor [Consotaella salsifontis]|uniref:Response regulatory domain-containing protein n=1 Tax=Consotaella salsifontis TaxID=1365950 RepID=A0A1T4SXG2_9HYPH|nr:response regulator transcription factor [Consotaella salsifontis]SKA32876.1 hypothetical protein SAMN05428963_11568 [Consotaella salsifontis]